MQPSGGRRDSAPAPALRRSRPSRPVPASTGELTGADEHDVAAADGAARALRLDRRLEVGDRDRVAVRQLAGVRLQVAADVQQNPARDDDGCRVLDAVTRSPRVTTSPRRGDKTQAMPWSKMWPRPSTASSTAAASMASSAPPIPCRKPGFLAPRTAMRACVCTRLSTTHSPSADRWCRRTGRATRRDPSRQGRGVHRLAHVDEVERAEQVVLAQRPQLRKASAARRPRPRDPCDRGPTGSWMAG